MEKWIEDLLVLQESDMRIRKMRVRLVEIPKERAKIAAEIEGKKLVLDDFRARVMTAEKDIALVKSEIDEQNEKGNKLQTQSSQIKDNREYKALMSEIETVKRKTGEIEARQARHLESLEKNRLAFVEAQKVFAAFEKSCAERLEEVAELERSLNAEIDNASAARATALAALVKSAKPNIIPAYDRLLKAKGDPITQVHNGTCGNCHLKLTPQTMNDAKKGELPACDSCGHFVYFQSGD